MDFTVQYRQKGHQLQYSPDGQYLAHSHKERLVVRRCEDLEILHTFTCSYPIQDIQWNPHSDYILTASYARAHKVDVWCLSDPQWRAEIDESYVGLANARWSRDGAHVLTIAEFQLRLSIWSLLNGEAFYIQNPKYKDKGISYSPDGRFVAIAERHDSKDAVGVYSTNPWALQKQFVLETINMENLSWSPDGRYIAVWDTAMDYKVSIYNPLGVLKKSYSAYSEGLGIKATSWSPSAQFLALGSYDQQIRLLNTYNWSPFLTFKHVSNVTKPDVKIYVEVDASADVNDAGHKFATKKSLRRFELEDKYLNVPTVVPDASKPNPKLGVGLLDFNSNGEYMISRNDNMPNCLWIWDMKSLRLCTFIRMLDPVRIVRWNPVLPNLLAFACTENCVYLWRSEKGCEFYELPAANFQLVNFKWSPTGRSLAFMDKELFHLGYLTRHPTHAEED